MNLNLNELVKRILHTMTNVPTHENDVEELNRALKMLHELCEKYGIEHE